MPASVPCLTSHSGDSGSHFNSTGTSRNGARAPTQGMMRQPCAGMSQPETGPATAKPTEKPQ